MQRLFLSSVIMLQVAICAASEIAVEANPVWSRPTILPLPERVDGVARPVVSLAGTWKLNLTPPPGFHTDDTDVSSWSDVKVPGQISRQGFGTGDWNEVLSPYAYKTKLSIPADFAGKRIFLQFHGVTGTATAWVNGREMAKHVGGFTLWNIEITDVLKPNDDNWLTVQVKAGTNTDSTVGVRYPGGIIRNVYLIALPQEHFTRFNIETDLDDDYRDVVMKVWVGGAIESEATVELTLTAPDGTLVTLDSPQIELSADRQERIVAIPIAAPLKWDAEHPNLYTLKAELVQGGNTLQVISKKVGFREIRVDGKRLLVNGNEVKLRGAAQFDSDPLHGRAMSPGLAELDVKLYKAANMNFARPSVYPANIEFLEASDRLGLYVLCECPCWNGGTPEMAPLYLSQTSEMVEAYRSHPSIIMWNLANETWYTDNIGKQGEYIHAEDKTRPVIFSFAQSVPLDRPLPYEIYSAHYPNWHWDLGAPSASEPFFGLLSFTGGAVGLNRIPPMPVLADEYAHLPTNDTEERERDPNVHAFWGESIKRFWESMFTTPGSLGGAIWAFVDDPKRNSLDVYGWGLVDVWRRPRPEYWLAKKAYSPVRLEDKPVAHPGTGKALLLPIQNWFDHTNLNEVQVDWRVGVDSGSIAGPDVAPHAKGLLTIPARAWKPGDEVHLQFTAADGMIIDEYIIPIAATAHDEPELAQAPAPKLEERKDHFVVSGREFSVTLDRKTGLITSGAFEGKELIKRGPELNLVGATLSDWALWTLEAAMEDREAVFKIRGMYNVVPERVFVWDEVAKKDVTPPQPEPVTMEVRYIIRIDGAGRITIQYLIDRFDLPTPSVRLRPWNNTSAGGYQEVGITLDLIGGIDRLSWSRDGLWSVYPDDHIARNRGTAVRHGFVQRVDERPDWNWAMEESPAGAGTNDFRSQKEYIRHAYAWASSANVGVRAESAGTDAVRLEVADRSKSDSEVRMHINKQWNYRHLGNGNYMKPPVIVYNGYTGTVRVRMCSTGTDSSHSAGD